MGQPKWNGLKAHFWLDCCLLDIRMGKRPFSHSAVFLFISVNTWSLKLAMTFSLLCLPSFPGPAQTPGWVHFPLNYQNRADLIGGAVWKTALFPGPAQGDLSSLSLQSLGAAGQLKRDILSLRRHSFLQQARIVLCALTQLGLGGVAGGMAAPTLLNRNTASPTLMPRAQEPAHSPLLRSASVCGRIRGDTPGMG